MIWRPGLISNEEAVAIIRDVETLEANRHFRNFVAQAHSRSILRRLQAPAETWPGYTLSDEDLYFTAYYLLWQGLQLKPIPEHSRRADQYIKQACEVLEFLYASLPAGHPERTEGLFSAALGYYISGYYARAYVMMRDLQTSTSLPEELELLRRLLEKDLVGMRVLVSSILDDQAFSDETIATELRGGMLSQDEAIARILQASLNRAFSYYIEYPKSGDRSLLDDARELVDRGIQLALETGFVDWWWILYCTRYLFDEYDASSFWTTLAPMDGDDPENRLVQPYIRANYVRRIPVIELWRSQIAALPYINEPARGSYCLKMPTSAGKTRIAELAILRFLLDEAERVDPTGKCIYIAPFRSLAVEVEGSLREVFHPLGARVSEIYGGFELSPVERLLMDETRILVATPEKIDALLRYSPELAEQIRLIVIDEGHIISLSDRGIYYEFFLHRLIRRFAKKQVRIFFLSAVLPNSEEFAQWITNDPTNVISADWRPSRLLVGELRWDGKTARIDYLQADHEPLGHECFLPSFIVPVDPRGLPGVRYKRRFPDSIGDVVAEAAVLFAQQGTTMIFCTRKASVRPMAEDVVRSLRIHQALASLQRGRFAWPMSNEAGEAVRECILFAQDYMGRDNDVAKYLEYGFVVHDTGIPKPVRIRLEKLVRTGAIRLVVATTTLAQGVNFPIQTVIVHGLSHGYREDLSPMTFWNVCGRAGRGMQENEGQVLFAVDLDLPNVPVKLPRGLTPTQIERATAEARERRIRKDRRIRREIVSGYRAYRLLSSLRQLLDRVQRIWTDAFGTLEMAKLCTYLAENNLGWIPQQENEKFENWLNVLDGELLALIEELGEDPASPDIIQRVMGGSLLFLQANDAQDAAGVISRLTDMLTARWHYVRTQIQGDHSRQRRFYTLGFKLQDCQAIEESAPELLKFLLQAAGFAEWTAPERCSYMVELARTILDLVTQLAPAKNQAQRAWESVLTLWLSGMTPNEIALNASVSECTCSPAEVSAYIEDVFVYKMPWGLNALTVYLDDLAAEANVELPGIISFFPDLFKRGVHSPVASSFLAFGLTSRKLALKLATAYQEDETAVDGILTWFLNVGEEELLPLGFTDSEIEAIQIARETVWAFEHHELAEHQTTVRVRTARVPADLAPGNMLLLQLHPELSPYAYSLTTLSGEQIGLCKHREALPLQWSSPERTMVRVMDIELEEGAKSIIQVQIEVI